MRIFITGGDGQVATDLKKIALQKKFIFSAPSRHELDITDAAALQTAIEKFKPDVVINTAAYTQVDRAEQEIETAFAVNRDGAKYLAIICEKLKCPLLHLSTDYVFDGQQHHPYLETDLATPINQYGASKLSGEEEIQKHCENYLILRVSAVFGIQGHNFVKTILRLARERELLRIVNDQVTCPTPAAAIAETLIRVSENPQRGIFHYCGNEPTNWCEFAKDIIEQANHFEPLMVKQIDGIATREYPTPAKRPSYSVLNCEKFKTVFGIQQPDWKLGLNNVITTLYST